MVNPMSQAALNTLYREARGELRRFADGAALGYFTPQEFGNHVAEALEEFHTRATIIGRQYAGDRAPEEADDRAFAEDVVDEQSEFLASFVRDLENGRYDDAPEALVARAESYANRLVGTANEALTLASDEAVRWKWRLGREVKHCPECPSYARRGPYTADDLQAMGHPGTADTTCKHNCRCWLERTDGLRGFALPEAEAA